MKSDALGFDLRHFVWASAVFTLAIFGTAQRVHVDDPPPALYLTLTNLPAKWELQSTRDLTNWYSVTLSGDVPPKEVSVQLTNTAHAQFYRVVSR